MNGSDLQILGRCHLHCTLLSHAAFCLRARKIQSTIAPLPAVHRAHTTSAPCRLASPVIRLSTAS